MMGPKSLAKFAYTPCRFQFKFSFSGEHCSGGSAVQPSSSSDDSDAAFMCCENYDSSSEPCFWYDKAITENNQMYPICQVISFFQFKV